MFTETATKKKKFGFPELKRGIYMCTPTRGAGKVVTQAAQAIHGVLFFPAFGTMYDDSLTLILRFSRQWLGRFKWNLSKMR
ncbi:hypothetical protein M8C21_026072, partial [Ambrosia artemisiifolia]